MSQEQHRIAGVLPTAAALQGVIDDLETHGFDRSQFGVLASQDTLAADGGDAAALAADPKAHSEAGVEPESGGALTGALVGGLFYLGAAAAAGAVILTGGGLGLALAALVGAGGAGGLVGALVGHGFHQEQAELIESQIAAGGLVLWIQPRDDAQAEAAKAQLERAGATRIVVQDAA
jgi:hypothetical protein